jgi:hypothetical protein
VNPRPRAQDNMACGDDNGFGPHPCLRLLPEPGAMAGTPPPGSLHLRTARHERS